MLVVSRKPGQSFMVFKTGGFKATVTLVSTTREVIRFKIDYGVQCKERVFYASGTFRIEGFKIDVRSRGPLSGRVKFIMDLPQEIKVTWSQSMPAVQ